VGLTGRAGTGKSTVAKRLAQKLWDLGHRSDILQLDSFFIMSRRERKCWLQEQGLSSEEQDHRENQLNWWAFDRAAQALQQLKAGQRVYIPDAYDMGRGGEKIGVVDINPDPLGHTILFEGVALLHPSFHGLIDDLIYIHTQPATRTEALWGRNSRNGYSQDEHVARKAITDHSEDTVFFSLGARRRALQRYPRMRVLDNSARNSTLGLLPRYIPRF
jgi:uridine kinase